jgi:hypothetical protein
MRMMVIPISVMKGTHLVVLEGVAMIVSTVDGEMGREDLVHAGLDLEGKEFLKTRMLQVERDNVI